MSSVTTSTKNSPTPTLVKAVHFISLAELYVVPEEKFKLWEKVTQDCKMVGRQQPPVENVELNAIYLVKHNNEWHRGLTVSTEQHNEYLCHLIDTGKHCKVTEIRELPKELADHSYLIKCAFFDILPFGNIAEIEFIVDCILIE